MEITTHLAPEYTEKIALIQAQTQQDISEIVSRAIDLYFLTLQKTTPNALELFQTAGLVGCINTDPSVPYQTVIQEYLEHKHDRHQQ
jgi:hypothetical protein